MQSWPFHLSSVKILVHFSAFTSDEDLALPLFLFTFYIIQALCFYGSSGPVSMVVWHLVMHSTGQSSTPTTRWLLVY